MIIHPIEPLYDASSTMLILGSFPSVKSREAMFFYGHPQNRFWKVMASLYDCQPLDTIDEKRQFALQHHIALWDVIASCSIKGSADHTIQDVVPNDLRPLLENSHIDRIFVNGKTAEKYYKQYIEPVIGIKAIVLPSTSPANASWSLERLLEAWKCIKESDDS